ncbi:aldose 1-epimerase family protein [Simiduia sp. 21SJ11W-1]|uniref:aldose 1-epimerase family protein n=1 Tax=Simiduia sp. 21SJ11W-1 TaxID=2909669 RepID=UPI0020A11EA5|nr:aldose 1-epimerase family protein [Simiduia sp. 21SJ11W-1]UTA48292.1 aldose 1-epimerase family protein [Simiduia sp. 21SJ11W-1]
MHASDVNASRIYLENDALSVTVNCRGAELASLICKSTGRQLLWQGDASIWRGQAPVLFPVVGRLREQGFEYEGRFYPMPIHGFASSACFKVQILTPECVTLRLEDSPATRSGYPFPFCLDVSFSLQGSKLAVDYRVVNTGLGDMYFSLGSHPAFALPEWADSHWPVALEFEKEELPRCFRIRNSLLGQAEPSPFVGRRLPITPATFAEDALIFRNINSQRLWLWVGDDRQLEFDTGGAPHLGVWAKPGAPYVCIEPWLTTDDGPDAPLDITKKPGFIALAPQSDYHLGYAISVKDH